MSVINKMLRDLDARNQLPSAASRPIPAMASATVGSLGAAAKPAVAWTRTVLRIGAALILVVVAATAWWWQQGSSGPSLGRAGASPPLPQPQVPTDTVAAESQRVVTEPEQSPSDQLGKPPKPTSTALTKPSIPSKVTAPVTVQATQAQPGAPVLHAQVVPAKLASAAAAATALAMGPGSAVAGGVTLVPTGSTGSASTPSSTLAPLAAAEQSGSTNRQAQGGREALLQAQALWNAGSHDAAVDLLQQALSLLERSSGSPTSASQGAMLASIVRELGRMLVAERRPAAALEMLSRMEPLLGKEADIWALRGNAAQRLGRHQESVSAYATALQLRPNEQRWLLASAVSLAALGQTANASDMAAKATALGPVSKEVQAYLRQAGVRLAEP